MALTDICFSWVGFMVLSVFLLLYNVLKFIYRVMIHPLAKFPGPKLAGMTYKYEFYFDGIRDGRYTEEIMKMHEKYGPIVRINPNELHCNDPNFTDQVYAGAGKRREKSKYFIGGLGSVIRKSGFGTIDHDLHRIRRGAVNKFFSKAAITKMEPKIQTLAQKLCDKMLYKTSEKGPLDVTLAYSCFTVDVISSYCYGHDDGYLDLEDFTSNIRPGLLIGANLQIPGRQWPLMFTVMDMMPTSLVTRFAPEFTTWFSFMNVLTDQVKKLKKDYDEGRDEALKGRTTVFREVLESSLPQEEKSLERLGSEAVTIVGAGTETTAWALTVLTFHILSRQDILSNLEQELSTVVDDPKITPPWVVLEHLPYLSATILEGIRHSYGVATRLSRVAPDEALVYRGTSKCPGDDFDKPIELIIPPGTAIGMSSYIMHANPEIFPEPEKFVPERWLNADGSRRKDLETYLMSFSRGSRQCLGINLAYCELYTVIASLLLRVFPAVELFETTVKDVKYHHEKFIMLPDPSSQGVRVTAKDQ